MSEASEQLYPAITDWVKGQGWIEVGRDDYSTSLIRALDDGGMIWESAEDYQRLDDAFRALETALMEWMEKNG